MDEKIALVSPMTNVWVRLEPADEIRAQSPFLLFHPTLSSIFFMNTFTTARELVRTHDACTAPVSVMFEQSEHSYSLLCCRPKISTVLGTIGCT